MSFAEIVRGMDVDHATNVIIGIFSAVGGIIAFILKFRKNHPSGGDEAPPDFTTALLAERAALVKERDKALATAANAWRDREKLTTDLARLTAESEYLHKEVAATNRRIDVLMRAINRLNPELLQAFGSDFTPL